MKRRSLLQAGLAMAGATLLTGLSSYPQWYALGPKHWRIVAARGNAEASRLAGAVSALLAARVAGSQAIPAEAETDREVLQLLRTHEVELAILSIAAANDALSGSGAAFADGPVALTTVAPFGPHLLVALESYSSDKAARIAAALAGFRWQDGSAPTRGSGPQSKVPLHPGAIRFKQARESRIGQ